MAIEITRRTNGGYTIEVGTNDPIYVSQLGYYSSPDGVRLLLPGRATDAAVHPYSWPAADWTIQGATGYTTLAQVADALDGIGLSTGDILDDIENALTRGGQQTQVVDAAGENMFVSTPVREISASLTRPADTANYAPGDHISAAVANVKKKDTVTLTGTGGTANISAAGGLTKLATFATDLATTAANFVTAHAAAYLAVGIVVTSSGSGLIFEANVAGVPFTTPVITNVTTDLAGTVANTTSNVTLVPVLLDDMSSDLGEGGIIMDVVVTTTITQLAGQTLRIWLFNATPSGIVGDNVAFTNLVANASKRVGSGYVDVPLNALLTGSDSIVGVASPAASFKCATSDTTIYALVQTLGAATAPTSAGIINMKFTVINLTK